MMAVGHEVSDDPSALPVVKIKLPWTFIATCIGALATTLITMWASVNRLTDEVRELKTAVQTGNQLVGNLQVDVGILKVQTGDTKLRLDRHLENPSRREN